ncbi:Oxysterol-binding protein-related protein 9, partial [Dissostichus eleginoides]
EAASESADSGQPIRARGALNTARLTSSLSVTLLTSAGPRDGKYEEPGATLTPPQPLSLASFACPPQPLVANPAVQNWSHHLDPPNTDHMWVQPWQSDCIVEQAAEFIRKKLARRSAGLAPIGQSRGPLRLRAPQTFLRIIFSIPLLSS